jgi:hypothetical protein
MRRSPDLDLIKEAEQVSPGWQVSGQNGSSRVAAVPFRNPPPQTAEGNWGYRVVQPEGKICCRFAVFCSRTDNARNLRLVKGLCGGISFRPSAVDRGLSQSRRDAGGAAMRGRQVMP